MLQSGTTFVTPTGVPFGFPGGDTNADGDNDAADASQIQSWINGSAYDATGDVDLDGDVDGTDKALVQSAPVNGVALGANRLTSASLRNHSGFSGLVSLRDNAYLARRRQYCSSIGTWNSRDPIPVFTGYGLYAYSDNAPVSMVDPLGLQPVPVATCLKLVRHGPFAVDPDEYHNQCPADRDYSDVDANTLRKAIQKNLDAYCCPRQQQRKANPSLTQAGGKCDPDSPHKPKTKKLQKAVRDGYDGEWSALTYEPAGDSSFGKEYNVYCDIDVRNDCRGDSCPPQQASK